MSRLITCFTASDPLGFSNPGGNEYVAHEVTEEKHTGPMRVYGSEGVEILGFGAKIL
jgi:hypothetical protein